MTEKAHVCSEHQMAAGLDLSAYPKVVRFCRVCRAPMRVIPIDDLPEEDFDQALQFIHFLKTKGSEGGLN